MSDASPDPIPTVTTVGRAIVPGVPEEVELSIGLEAVRLTPDDALKEVARRSARVAELLDGLAIDRAARSTAAVSVREEVAWENNSRVHKGFRAVDRLVLRLTDFDKVGPILRDATKEAQARVEGPSWRIALDNPARGEACRRAAIEARERAGFYAEALGGKLGRVLAVVEPGATVPGPRTVVRGFAAAGPEPELDIEAGELDIAAAVEVTYEFLAD